LCADPTIDKNYNPVTNEFVAVPDGGTGGAGGGTGGMGGAVTGTGGAAGSSGAPSGVAINVSSIGSAFNYTQGSYLIGFKFRVNSAITVTDLGFWDSNLTGTAETFVPVPVGLYDLSTNTLLGFAAVQASDPATGFFRYASLATPIALNTTDNYAVVGVSGTNNYAVGVGSCSGGFACSQATMNTAVTFLGGACLGAQCLTTTNTLAEPTDFETWANFGANFMFATGSGGSDAGVDAAVANPGDSGAGGGSSGGGDAGVDVPVGSPGDSGTGAGGTGGSSGGATGSIKRDAGIAGASGTTCAPGQTPTKFRFPATSDSDPSYTSGVGVLTATELLAFNAYAGPDSADGGPGAMVNRIDVQHFDPSTGASKGPAAPLLTAATDSGIFINGAAVAPTGEIAIIYSAATHGGYWGAYLVFLDKNLAPTQTTLFVVAGSENNHNQSYVQWLNGQFVASDVFNNQTIKLGRFGTDGSNLGITRAVPTDNPSATVNPYDRSSGEVAFSGSTFAVAFSSDATDLPLLTFVDALDPLSAEVASPVALPSANSGNLPLAVAGTSQGFVAVYNGTSSSKTNSLLATYVSNSPSGDAGVPVGATYAFLGGFACNSAWSTRGSSDGTGAGFAALYPDGSVSFLYFSGDGSMHGNPQTVLQQTGTAGSSDEAHLTSFAGKFAVSLYSSGEHLTRVITSSCQ
jgi:hypothetical protein